MPTRYFQGEATPKTRGKEIFLSTEKGERFPSPLINPFQRFPTLLTRGSNRYGRRVARRIPPTGRNEYPFRGGLARLRRSFLRIRRIESERSPAVTRRPSRRILSEEIGNVTLNRIIGCGFIFIALTAAQRYWGAMGCSERLLSLLLDRYGTKWLWLEYDIIHILNRIY